MNQISVDSSPASLPSQATSRNLLFDACLESHRQLVEHALRPDAATTEGDLIEWLSMGNVIAKHYLRGLRQLVGNFGRPDGRDGSGYFEKFLLEHVRALNDMLCDLARLGRRQASGELFDQALLLSMTFAELALKDPTPFKSKAQRSLYMPSVRGKSPKFTADAKAIAEGIELSAQTVGDGLTDNRKPLGAMCARLVGECVNEIKQARLLWADVDRFRPAELVWPTAKEIKPFFGKNFQETLAVRKPYIQGIIKETRARANLRRKLFIFSNLEGCGSNRLHFLCLPELTRATAQTWWKQAVEAMIAAKFPELKEQPIWAKELKAASSGTPADMLKVLKDYSRGKVRQFAEKMTGRAQAAAG